MRHATLPVLALCAAAAAAPAAGVPDGLLPSEAATLMRAAMDRHPEAPRRDNTAPYAARVPNAEYEGDERFMKGELHFMNFEPEPSRDAFWPFRFEPGLRGRVATQRLMIIRLNAFSMLDEVLEEDLPRYLEGYAPIPEDRHDEAYPVQIIAGKLIERGETERAFDLVERTVRRHGDIRSPHTAHLLPALFLEASRKAGETARMHRLMDDSIRGLGQALERRRAARPENAARPGVPQMPGAVLFGPFEDQRLSYDQWTLLYEQLLRRLREARAGIET